MYFIYMVELNMALKEPIQERIIRRDFILLPGGNHKRDRTESASGSLYSYTQDSNPDG